jgi:hypothetical protein
LLIDLTPEELMERLERGKVYVVLQAERALVNFFQKSNLVALRELSLRQAAHRLAWRWRWIFPVRAAALPNGTGSLNTANTSASVSCASGAPIETKLSQAH